MDEQLERRAKKLMMDILDNEALTADLDDDVAKVFVNWVESRIFKLVAESGSEMDEEELLKTTRQLARSLGRMTEKDGRQAELEKTVASMAKLYQRESFKLNSAQTESLHALLQVGMREFIEGMIEIFEPPAQTTHHSKRFREL